MGTSCCQKVSNDSHRCRQFCAASDSIADAPFFCFCSTLVYNIGRGILLWKTKTLELEMECSGVHPHFSLQRGWWEWLFHAVRIGFLLNILAVLFHSFIFLQREIPIH